MVKPMVWSKKYVKQFHEIVVFQHMKTEDLIWWLVGSPQSLTYPQEKNGTRTHSMVHHEFAAFGYETSHWVPLKCDGQ